MIGASSLAAGACILVGEIWLDIIGAFLLLLTTRGLCIFAGGNSSLELLLVVLACVQWDSIDSYRQKRSKVLSHFIFTGMVKSDDAVQNSSTIMNCLDQNLNKTGKFVD